MGRKVQDLTGKKFGMLHLLDIKRENRRTYYLCKCECGNEKWIRGDSIKSGKQQSCGCMLDGKFKFKDLSNQKNGKLTITDQFRKKDNGYEWYCKCECGNEKWISSSDLRSSLSCGCLKKEIILERQKLAYNKYKDKYLIDSTNIAVITNNKPMSHNTSGVTGVLWDKSRQRWKAEIIFKNKKYYLGRYEKKEDAINARKEAEERLHKEFLREKGIID